MARNTEKAFRVEYHRPRSVRIGLRVALSPDSFRNGISVQSGMSKGRVFYWGICSRSHVPYVDENHNDPAYRFGSTPFRKHSRSRSTLPSDDGFHYWRRPWAHSQNKSSTVLPSQAYGREVEGVFGRKQFMVVNFLVLPIRRLLSARTCSNNLALASEMFTRHTW